MTVLLPSWQRRHDKALHTTDETKRYSRVRDHRELHARTACAPPQVGGGHSRHDPVQLGLRFCDELHRLRRPEGTEAALDLCALTLAARPTTTLLPSLTI